MSTSSDVPPKPRFGLKRQAATASILLAAGAVSVVALACFWQGLLADTVHKSLRLDLPQSHLRCQIAAQVWRCRAAQAEFEIDQLSPERCQKALGSWHAAYRKLDELVQRSPSFESGSDKDALARWASQARQYRADFLEVVERTKSGELDSQAAVHQALSDCSTTLEKIARDADDQAEAHQGILRQSSRRLEELVDINGKLIALGGVLAILAVALAFSWISRSVLARIHVISAAAGQLAAGNRGTRLACQAGDELGILASQFNQLATLLLEQSPPAPELSRPQQAPLDPRPAPRAGCRILLAEDGPENQRLISFILKRAGAGVTIVENGEQALDRALAESRMARPGDPPAFDAILMDIDMPLMDGCEATRRLRQAGYDGLIIAVTGHAQRYDRKQCLQTGFDDYVAKPLDRSSLLKVLGDHCIEIGG